MKRFLLFLTLPITLVETVLAFERYRPTDAIEASIQQLVLVFKLNREIVVNDYLVDWTYIISRDDDQPITVSFSSRLRAPSYCQVTLGSESLMVIESNCY